MKAPRLILSLLFLSLLLIIPLLLPAQSRLMSYNIRYDNPHDGENAWGLRKAELVQLVKHYQPDIIGIQEGLERQVRFLDSALVGYDYLGVGREDGIRKGEYAAIFFNTERFSLISGHTFWLSETPDTISVGWDAALERIVTLGIFLDLSTMDTLCVLNTHFDHVGTAARERSARLILDIIDDMGLAKHELVLMGDLNCQPEEPPIGILTSFFDDPLGMPGSAFEGPPGTFNGFNATSVTDHRIDYILTRNCTPSSYMHIDEKRENGLWPSDHLPVLLIIK